MTRPCRPWCVLSSLAVCLSALVLVFSPGCSRIGRDAAAKDAAKTEHESADFTSLDQLTADVERPTGAAEIVMFHFAVKGPKDRWLDAFNAAFSRDLGRRVTRLPQVRGQVPSWVVTRAMAQHGIPSVPLDAQSAITAARVGGRGHALCGIIEREGEKLRANVGVYDAKTGKRVGEAIELVGTPQELLDREGWLAEQIAERIGVKLTAEDGSWLNRRQFRTLDNLLAAGRLMTQPDRDFAAKLAALREREPDALVLETAWLYSGLKDSSAYMAALEAAHKRFPQEPDFVQWIFDECLRLGDKAGAKRALDEYLGLSPGSWQGLNMRARYRHYMEHDFASALRATESLAVLYPGCWESWFRCSWEALELAYKMRAGHYFGEMTKAQQRVFVRGMREALAAGERALALNDKDAELLTHMIHVYRENSRPQDAHDMFDQAIAIAPGHIEAYNALASMYKRGYHNNEARRMEILKQSLAAPAKTWQDLLAQAENALDLKDDDLAGKLFQKALAAAGSSSCPELHTSYAAYVGEKLGRKEEAEKHARIAVQQSASVDGYLTLTWALSELSRFDDALAAANRAKELGAEQADYDAMLAQIQYQQGKWEQAFKAMGKAHAADVRDITYLAVIVGTYMKQGDYDKAWDACQELVQHPGIEESPDITRVVGDIHALKGRYKDAIRYYDMTLKKEPDDRDSLTHGALCHMFLGDNKRAAQRWQQAVSKHPDDAESHMGLAVCLNLLGEKQKSLAEARRAVKLNPDSANPQWLTEERHWPEKVARLAAQVAGSAAHE